jgi:hypothetical protein
MIESAKYLILVSVILNIISYHHHHLIYVATAGAQAFLMDYTQGQRAKVIDRCSQKNNE